MQKYFETITDPRQKWKVDYPLLEIIVMTIWAVISSCEEWEEIEDFSKVNIDWFRTKVGLKLEEGVASYHTFKRVFQIISPEELEECFFHWVKSIADLTSGEIVSIDGKSVRGTRDPKKKTLHLVNAWANENGLVLGQVKVDEKSNEITAIPTLLEQLELKGCIITIDAMGTQKDIAETIAKENDYVLALKGNHGDLYDDVKTYYELEKIPVAISTIEKDHGRIEKREYYLETEIDWIQSKQDWANLKSIGAVVSTVDRNGKTSIEVRYFISTLTDVEIFAKAVRGHWGVENSLHWMLDVTFKEDSSRMRKDFSAQNFSMLRKIAINALKSVESKKSINMRRKKCHYDVEFRTEVFDSVVLK